MMSVIVRLPVANWTERSGVTVSQPASVCPRSHPTYRPLSSSRGPRAPHASRNRRTAELYDLTKQGVWSADSAPPTPQPAPSQEAASAASSLLDDGWGVSVLPGSSAPTATSTKQAPAAKKAKKAAPTALAPAPEPSKASKKKSTATPFFDKNSEAGKLSLTLLQRKLMMEGKLSKEDMAQLQSTASQQPRQGKKTLPMPVKPKQRPLMFDDGDDDMAYDDEEEDEEVADTPDFEFTLGEDGKTEYIEYDRQGRVVRRRQEEPAGPDDDSDDDSDDDFNFGDDKDQQGWDQFVDTTDDQNKDENTLGSKVVSHLKPNPRKPVQLPAAPQPRRRDRRAEEMALLEDTDDDAKDGLSELRVRGQQSLLQQLGVVGDKAAAASATAARRNEVTWGGTAGSGVDFEEQEEILNQLFKPHKVAQLMAHQREAVDAAADLKRKSSGKYLLQSKVHSKLRIIAGSAQGKALASSQGALTRPMMEKVRQAIFNMIQAQAGSVNALPATARWLDLFAGTGSVGLEALSRGVKECHFVELDQWVTSKVLGKNIATCGFQRSSVVHTMKAEDFLRRARDLPRFAGGPFDFLSVCPPYLVVSYPELFELLEGSPLIHAGSIVFVEYPIQLRHEVPDALGPLVCVRDRKYGRTYIRVYAPPGLGEAA